MSFLEHLVLRETNGKGTQKRGGSLQSHQSEEMDGPD